jgi:transposase
MRSAVARSKTRWAAVATNTTRSIRSADDSATASNTSPRSSRPKISRCLDVGDPREEVNITWQCYQEPRSVYHAASAKGRQIAIKVLNSFHTCPIPEVARLGRTLRAWKAQILAYFDTSGVSNGGTEAINLIIEKVRRLAHGFKDFDHYRRRIMLAADGRRPYRQRPTHA